MKIRTSAPETCLGSIRPKVLNTWTSGGNPSKKRGVPEVVWKMGAARSAWAAAPT